MPFPWAAVASPAELPGPVFDGPAVAAAFAGAGAGVDAPEPGVVTAEGSVAASEAGVASAETGVATAVAPAVPPKLVKYETRPFISAAFNVNATMPAAFILAVGALRSAVN
jgi:hypothetical protein